MLIKLSTGGDEKLAGLIARQTPLSKGLWQGIDFAINSPVDQCDWWVVCHATALTKEEFVKCDPNHVVFISMEPPVWGCPRDFYNQFSHLISCDQSARHRNQILKNGLTWWVGLKVKFDNGHQISPEYSFDYDSLSNLEPQKKDNKISVITSGGTHFPGHKKRLKFLDKLLANQISEHIDFYGGRHGPVEDKMDALKSYRYHLALENSVVPHYWTEKLADPFLAWCLPIYYGCPNVESYFPRSSLVTIDIDDFDATLRSLWELLESDLYSRSIEQIRSARNLVLNEYNIFQLIVDTCKAPADYYELCSLRPPSSFSKRSSRIVRKVRSTVKKVTDNFFS